MIGTTIGQYEVRRLLGKGGMGEVYEAVQTQLGRRVAIKILNAEFARDPNVLARFFNEARAVNVVSHPGVVQISEFGQLPAGSAYLIMEYLDGETLSTRLRRVGGVLPEREVIHIGWQLSSVLAATHAHGIVHRDVTPNPTPGLQVTHIRGHRRRVARGVRTSARGTLVATVRGPFAGGKP